MELLIIVFSLFSFIVFCWVGIYSLAKKNICFSPILKGEIKISLWNGLPHKFFGKFAKGSYVDSLGNIIQGERYIETKTGVVKDGVIKESFLERNFGVIWIGLPPYGKLHKWKLSYSKWENQESGTDKLVVVKDKIVDTLHVRPTFAFVVDEAETADKVPLTIKGKYTLSLVNVMIAVFSNKNWITNIESAIVATIVDYIKAITYDIFMEKKIELGSDFIPKIMSINLDGKGNQSISRYGFMLEDISITSIEISGAGKDEITKATTAVKVAQENAKAEIKKAEGLAKSAIEQAKGIKSLCKALGENSDQIGILKIAEALANQTGPWALGGGILPTMDLTKKDKE